MSLTAAEARRIALSFPGTLEKMSYGTPAIFIGKQLFVRIGTREPDTLMLGASSFEARDLLIQSDPATFFVTEHFRSYKGLLARLKTLDRKTLRALLERRWREIAPKKLRQERG